MAEETKVESKTEPDYTKIGPVIESFQESYDGERFKAALVRYVRALQKMHAMDAYALLLLFDDRNEISEFHSNRIYRAAAEVNAKKNILLLVHSAGGRIEPAYLISKTCKRRSKEKFIVGVPRKAKSAATLLSLGADEVHMGLMSELGPIDPQVGGFPALGMKNALALLADLTCKYPGASSMLSEYLNKKLDLHLLGYFERISESAVQYAERLLPSHVLPAGKTASELANHFVNHYKDHGFVIDADEAESLLGDKIVKQNTKEYALVNDVYEGLDLIRFVLDMYQNKSFEYVGSIDMGLVVHETKTAAA